MSLVGDRRVAIILVLVLCFAIVSIPQIGVIKAEPKTIVVPDDYLTIQEAIDYASEGDTVFVKNGIYDGDLYIERPISLVGEDRNATFIIGKIRAFGGPPTVKITSDNVTITNFTIKDTDQAIPLYYSVGIWIEEASYCHIAGNIVQNSSDAIITYGGSNNIISGNYVTENTEHAIYSDSSNSIISENKIVGGIPVWGNSWTGITVQGINVTVSDNEIRNCFVGIHLRWWNNFKVFRNNITGNTDVGILIGGDSYGNTIFENHIENNNIAIGFRINDNASNNNTFYRNNFVNNNQTLESNDHYERWDNGFEGNCWSDYEGIDNNGDGIGDTPYIMDENNKDNYPLMNPLIPITQEPEAFPTTWILIIIGIITVVGVAILLYFKKFKKIK